MAERRPVTLITGASAGIGTELARLFAAHGHHLALVARRKGVLAQLADEIAASGGPRPLVLPVDLGKRDAADQIGAALSIGGFEPEYVVTAKRRSSTGASSSR
jgi:hypothetical protein